MRRWELIRRLAPTAGMFAVIALTGLLTGPTVRQRPTL